MGVTPDGISFAACPFCGHTPNIYYFPEREEHIYEATCEAHGCRVNVFAFGNTLEQLSERWNGRF